MKKLFVLFLMIASLLMITSCKPKEYTVTLKFEDGSVYETLIVEKGASVTLENPTKDGHTFKGWYNNEELVDGTNVFNEDTTLIGKFDINSYTYKFIVDGVIIKEETANYNSIIEFPEDPVKESTKENTYSFKEWDNEATVLLKDEVFNAVFESSTNKYTYKFVDSDGTVLKEETLEYGSSISYPTNPTKESTKEYTYTFTGWDKDVEVLTEDITFTATYSETKNQYTYKFVDDNGKVLKEETVEYGSTISYPTDPEKESTKEYTYTFTGWDKDVTVLTEDITFTATYSETKNKYTYKFVDDNGKVLKEETLEYGSTISYPADPEKESTKEYTYTFTGWDKDVTVLTEDITFTATYSKTKNQYTYKFVDDNGKVLKEETVDYGTMPVAPSDPVKEATDEYEYTFIGWDKKLSKVVDDVVYTAVYEEKEIKDEITSLDGLKVSFLGDSISTFYAEGSEMNSYYGGENQFFYPRYSHSIKTVNLTWWYQLIKNNNMVLGVNNSWSGSQACGTGNSAGQSDYRINTINENGNPDIVIVYLGTNDLGSSRTIADLESAITNIINKVNAKCDTQIFLTTLGYSAYSGGSYTDENRVLYNAKLRELASKFECGIVPLDEYVVDDNYMIYLEDSLHYNAKGANLLSLIAEKAIKDYYGITFDKEIVVEHQEKLPEGVTGKVTATTDTNFWGLYQTDVFLVDSSFTNPIYSLRIELTKNDENGKIYVTNIQASGTSTAYNCDLVIIISDSHNDSKALKTLLANVGIGNLVEFNESISFPVEITFKEGDGSAPEVTPDEEPEETNPPVDGQLHVCAYNEGVWVESIYTNGAICFTYEDMDKTSTFINYYIISLTYDETLSKYKITNLKNIDVASTFDECDYYIMIFRDNADKSYYQNANIGDYVVMNGDVTTGSCNLLFE